MLREQGVSAGNCSSMNARGFESDDGFFLPDPWCTKEKVDPPELGIFHRVVSRQVREYINKDQGLSKSDYFAFLKFLGTHGLGAGTVSSICRQLAGKVFSSGKTSWKRVPLLDNIQFDVFRYCWRKKKLRYSSLFVNSVAHYQHAYWRHFQPEAFETPPSDDEIEQYGGAVFYGYSEMDKIVGKFLKLESEGARFVFASALSQKPFLKHDWVGGQIFYRPKNVETPLAELGVESMDVQPVMTHHFLAHFGSEDAAKTAKERSGVSPSAASRSSTSPTRSRARSTSAGRSSRSRTATRRSGSRAVPKSRFATSST